MAASAVNKVGQKYRSFITETVTPEELLNPIGNVQYQLSHQNEYVSVNWLHSDEDPTLIATMGDNTPGKDMQTSQTPCGNGFNHDPSATEDSIR